MSEYAHAFHHAAPCNDILLPKRYGICAYMGVMTAILFDKLAYVEALQGSGISKKETTAHASALDTAMREGVATSADLVDIRAEIAEVRHEMQMLGRDLTIRLGGMLVTGIAVVAALVKLL